MLGIDGNRNISCNLCSCERRIKEFVVGKTRNRKNNTDFLSEPQQRVMRITSF